MAKNLTWEVPSRVWSEGIQTNTEFLTVTAAGIGTGNGQYETAQLVTPADVETAEKDFVWVERIVGQVFIVGINENLDSGSTYMGFVKERIHIGRQFHDSAGVPLVIFEDPWIEDGAQESFLWERNCWRHVVAPTDAPVGNAWPTFANAIIPGMSDGAHPWSTVIDVRVGRALRPQMALGYSVAVIDVSNVVYLAYGWIRLLVSRGG